MSTFLLLFLAARQDASAYEIFGKITDQSGAPCRGVTVMAYNSISGPDTTSTPTDAEGRYSLRVESGSGNFNFTAVPPAEAGLVASRAVWREITADLNLDFVLLAPGVPVLSGRLLDETGKGIASKRLELVPGFYGSVVTDAEGHYSFTSFPGSANNIPQDYSLLVDAFLFSTNAPEDFSLATSAFHVNGSPRMDFTLPAKRVKVHVQDEQGHAVTGVRIGSGSSSYCMNLILPPGTAQGYSSSTGVTTTDQNGDVLLWLFPNEPGSPYTFWAQPPPATGLVLAILSSIAVVDDTDFTMTLRQGEVGTGILSGRLLDETGEGIPGQTMQLVKDDGNVYSVLTDAQGRYLFAVPSGNYRIGAQTYSCGVMLHAPIYYSLRSYSMLHLSGSNSLDLVFPARRVQVHVQDALGNGLPGIPIEAEGGGNDNLKLGPFTAHGGGGYFIYAGPMGSCSTLPITDGNGNVTLWLFPTGRNNPIYIDVAGLWLRLLPITIVGDRDFTITLGEPPRFSGHLLDETGQGVSGHVYLKASGTNVGHCLTSPDGGFSFGFVPGEYSLEVNASEAVGFNVPQKYSLASVPFHLGSSTSVDLSLPAKRIKAHVQDQLGNAVSGVQIGSDYPWNTNLSLGPFTVEGYSGYGLDRGAATPTTDLYGDAVLWLFPNEPGGAYTLTCKLPLESTLDSFTVPNVEVTTDADLNVVLPPTHQPPVTTATVSGSRNGRGAYLGAVTIILTASAEPGFAVRATTYDLDADATLSYIGPFTVSAPGQHTLSYRSVDGDDIREIPKLLTFEVVRLQPADISSQVTVTRSGLRLNRATQRFMQTVTLKNAGSADIVGPIGLELVSLSANATLCNSNGAAGVCCVIVNVGTEGIFARGEVATVVLEFSNPRNQGITYRTCVWAEPGS